MTRKGDAFLVAQDLRGAPKWSGTRNSEREFERAARTIAGKKSSLEDHRCTICWQCVCICEAVVRLSLGVQLKHFKLTVLMHHKEWGKSTNTAKLLPIICQSNASIHVYPTELETVTASLCSKAPALLLWPGPGSLPASELRTWVAQQTERIELCVIDGTCAAQLPSRPCLNTPHSAAVRFHRTGGLRASCGQAATCTIFIAGGPTPRVWPSTYQDACSESTSTTRCSFR